MNNRLFATAEDDEVLDGTEAPEDAESSEASVDVSAEIEEAEGADDDPMTSVKKYLEAYTLITKDASVGEEGQSKYDIAPIILRAACLGNVYQHSVTMMNEVMDRQGKYRSAYSDEERQMMKYSLERDPEDTTADKLTALMVDVFNDYLSCNSEVDDQSLGIAEIKRRKDSVKVLLIELFKSNQYDIIPMLKIPVFAHKWVSDAFAMVDEAQTGILEEWIDYLSKHGNKVLVDYVKAAGNMFFKVPKAIATFPRFFQPVLGQIKDYDKTYMKFIEFRDRYTKASSNITRRSLYPLFEITDDAYNKRKALVYKDLFNKYSDLSEAGDGNLSKVLQSLAFGREAVN
jgi:hypothetical protein